MKNRWRNESGCGSQGERRGEAQWRGQGPENKDTAGEEDKKRYSERDGVYVQIHASWRELGRGREKEANTDWMEMCGRNMDKLVNQ